MSARNWSPSRRDLFRACGASALGVSSADWLPALAEELAADPRRRRHCILLWMGGGPSQTDTFDMKPGHNNGGEFKELPTSVPGVRFTEHLPQLAKQAEHLAIVRSLSTKEGDHARGAHLVRTGHPPGADVAYPSIACSLTKEFYERAAALPTYVSVAPPLQINPAAFGPGFLGPRYAPAIIGATAVDGDAEGGDESEFAQLQFENLELPRHANPDQAIRRMELWRAMQQGFLADRPPSEAFSAHDTLYRSAAEMMRPEVRAAFDLSAESDATRRRYGPGLFGQGCLLARRLVERGVPFVEVALGDDLGWDTHADNFRLVRGLSEQLDAGWATLMTELQERGLLENTTILWMGEFGRTPVINPQAGRDHFPAAWSCVFAGGGVNGGQAYGETSEDGMSVVENQVGIGDVLATLCAALGVAHDDENVTPADRPIKIAEGEPIRELLA